MVLISANAMIASPTGEEFGDPVGHSLRARGKEDDEHVLDEQR